MKIINLLYDATIIANSYFNQINRTGIYFVAYNILNQLVNNHIFNVILYIQDDVSAAKYFKKDILLSRFQVCVNNGDSLKYNIKNHIKKIKKNKNILKFAFYTYKIAKYCIYLLINYYNVYHNKIILESADIYFSPMYTAPSEILKYPEIKHFFFLHDMIPLIFPQYFHDVSSDDFWFNKLTRSFNKNTYYFCNSYSTKYDLLKYFNSKIDKEKITIVYPASSRNIYPCKEKSKLNKILNKYKINYEFNNNYIISFCTLEPRKNLLFTICCFIKFIKKHQIDNLFFFLCGGQWDKYYCQFGEQIENFSEYHEKIIYLGYVEDVDINILYSNSVFFIYISQYEGFGLPPLEAMQAGTPVITSDNSSLPEVVGDAAIKIDCYSEEQCIKAFEDLYFNEMLRKQYIEKGFEQVKLFSWEKTGDKIIEIMLNVLK
jgi:glycosyltransferase involved in cell wall biosynthesis